MDLIEARKRERYTQQQVADIMGISRPTYARMEKHPGGISVDDARKLASSGLMCRIFFSPGTIVTYSPQAGRAGGGGMRDEFLSFRDVCIRTCLTDRVPSPPARPGRERRSR